MIGQGFGFFLVNLVIAVLVSVVLHYLLAFRVRGGVGSYLSTVVIGWLGAWLGPPVFGHWFPGLTVAGVHWIPAILGSFALLILVIDIVKTCSVATGGGRAEPGREEPGRPGASEAT